MLAKITGCQANISCDFLQFLQVIGIICKYALTTFLPNSYIPFMAICYVIYEIVFYYEYSNLNNFYCLLLYKVSEKASKDGLLARTCFVRSYYIIIWIHDQNIVIIE
jgi:hypothetical protein